MKEKRKTLETRVRKKDPEASEIRMNEEDFKDLLGGILRGPAPPGKLKKKKRAPK